ncbi:MAG: alpha/beta fold hydrolase [Phycisphaerales bacterium]
MPRPIVLIPGLGADARLFHRQRAMFGDRLVVPPLLAARSGEDLAAYAGRIAEAIRDCLSAGSDAPEQRPVLGGISFGGQIALEASRHVPAHCIAVMSGCPSPDAIPLRFRLARAAGAPVPNGISKWMLRRLVGVFSARERLAPDDRAVLREMAADIDPRELHRQGAVCSNWRAPFEPSVPVHVLHGRRDWVIPMHAASQPEVVEDGRHLINLTHADRVNAWLAACADDVPRALDRAAG